MKPTEETMICDECTNKVAGYTCGFFDKDLCGSCTFMLFNELRFIPVNMIGAEPNNSPFTPRIIKTNNTPISKVIMCKSCSNKLAPIFNKSKENKLMEKEIGPEMNKIICDYLKKRRFVNEL